MAAHPIAMWELPLLAKQKEKQTPYHSSRPADSCTVCHTVARYLSYFRGKVRPLRDLVSSK